MTDYLRLKDIFEMAEVLSNEIDQTLEVECVETHSGEVKTVVFAFNAQRELVEVYIES